MRKVLVIAAGIVLLNLFATVVNAQQPMTADEIKTSIIGNTLTGYTARGFNVDAYYDPDGTMSGRVKSGDGQNFYDGGTWNLTDDGTLCRRWKTWGDAALACIRYYRAGNGRVHIRTVDGKDGGDYEVQQGDPLRMKGR